MKKIIHFCSTIMIATLIIFVISCKKDKENESNNPIPSITVTDIDGNIYHTITIGSQVWLKENLKVTHYRNGDTIPNITDCATWGSLTNGAYCDYDNTPSNSAIHGRLYNFYAVNDSRNIAPTGWHVPTDAEWTTLKDYLGGVSIAGGKLKEIDTTHWISPNTGANNITQFTALPSGCRSDMGDAFWVIGYFCYFWTATEYSSDHGWVYSLHYNDESLGKNYSFKKDGHSVRCIKD